MKIVFLLFSFIPLVSFASFDFGVGTSSVTYGRPAPSLALGYENGSWGMNYRSEGVQTKIYAQNAWTLAGVKIIHSEKFGPGGAILGAGIGGTYILRAYRISPNDTTEETKDYVLGPYLAVKYQVFGVYLGADTVLGMNAQGFTQHLTLNFQDVSHITFGISL